jgi:hypothetical protein
MQSKTASELLGNPNYQAISYGGYRKESREFQPTLDQLKEDLRIPICYGNQDRAHLQRTTSTRH